MQKLKVFHFIILLVMMAAQLSLAQHMSVHFTAHDHAYGHDIQHEQEHGHERPSTNELCQLCIFAKGFAHALTAEQNILHTLLPAHSYQPPAVQPHITQHPLHGYLARAPPSYLI